jgi:hypothetical protein
MIYTGYIHNTQNNIDELLILFEYKEEVNPKHKLQWATLHEIINTKTLMRTQIPILYKWFLQFPDLLYMTDKYDTSIDIPFVLYSLDMDTSDTSFYSVTTNTTPFIYYPKLGMKYFFSNNYIGEEGEEGTDRYVVFLNKTLYILDEKDEIKESISKYNSIYFQQKGEPIWAVSSVDFFTRI